MKDIGTIRNLYKPLKNTVLHPQWLSYRNKQVLIQWLKSISPHSIVVDIGCADRWVERYVDKTCNYIGLDNLETSEAWYRSDVDIYGTALALPLREQSVDVVILFDVLEHLSNCDTALSDIVRILKPGGVVLIQIPYLYPLHDCPNDFQRFTYYGLVALGENKGLIVDKVGYRGEPLETAVLLVNIALAKSVVTLSKNSFILRLLIYPLVGAVVVFLNCFGWAIGKFFPKDEFMPFSYHVVLKK